MPKVAALAKWMVLGTSPVVLDMNDHDFASATLHYAVTAFIAVVYTECLAQVRGACLRTWIGPHAVEALRPTAHDDVHCRRLCCRLGRVRLIELHGSHLYWKEYERAF